MNWTDLPRLESSGKRLDPETLPDGTIAINLDYGIHVYRNAIKKDQAAQIIVDLENELSLGIPAVQWSGALVNDREDTDYVRNCVDLRFKKEDLGKFIPKNDTLSRLYDQVDSSLDKCLLHYGNLWNLRMTYKEAFNFVKYSPGKYFKVHSDHGPYYTCTVSAVVYLNDDYEGGEIQFTRQGLTFKPEAGDIVLCPSNFVYEHSSLEIKSGTKYAVVVMTDYNDLFHKEGQYDQ